MLKYKINNRLNSAYANTQPINELSGVVLTSGRMITVPFTEQTKNDGYSDIINELFIEEKDQSVNAVIDTETIKFTSAKFGTEEPSQPNINFSFYNATADTFSYSYENAGFLPEEIENKRNNFKNSFFRIDFYDSDNIREQNFLFSEFLNVKEPETSFPFNRIFYKKESSKFKEGDFVELYFEVLFFNAKTGTVKNMVNKLPSTINLVQYNANPSQRFAKIKLLNPYIEQPYVGSLNKIFYIEPINGNNNNTIVFSELIIQP